MTPSFGEHTDGEVEVGWHLHPDSWRRGYATEIAQGALKKGFAEGLTQIYATVKPGNIKSIAVCHRLGMESLGLSSKWDDTEYELFRISNARYSRRPLPVHFRQKHPR
jgi:RimJ/RimL family protein N-acetyltransferase